MYYKTCEICGLKAGRVGDQKRTFMAKFPLDEERCKRWVQVTGKEDLAYVPIEKLHQLKHICGKHFRARDFKKKKTQLKKNAIPSLLITAEPLADQILMGFPLHIFEPSTSTSIKATEGRGTGNSKNSPRLALAPLICNPHIDHDYCRYNVGIPEPSTSPAIKATDYMDTGNSKNSPKPSTSTAIKATDYMDTGNSKNSPKPSTSTAIKATDYMDTGNSKNSPKPSTSTAIKATDYMDTGNSKNSPKPSTSTAIKATDYMDTGNSKNSPKPSTSTAIKATDCMDTGNFKNSPRLALAPLICDPEMEHNYCRFNVGTPNTSTSTTTAENSNNLKRKMPCIPKSSTKKPSENQMTPRKMKLLKKLKKSNSKLRILQKKICEIENISSPVLKSIIESSIKNQNRKPKGQRWTKLNKSVALAIYKKSPKAYRYLRQLLPMPSVRTLQTVLENMKMQPGIDSSVMAHLKNKAETLTAKDKICVLLFDEIALKRRLIYNAATDEIDGFEDLGDQGGRSEKIANHALVLMIQGIHKKIKQPIAHYFVKGTISSEKLLIIIKTAIRAVTEAGYKVLATVCDQGPTNVGAINLLKQFSGEPAESNFFLLDDEKVFIIYDVPHLFKSLRNNFLEGGVLKMDNKTAKWSHLLELQEKNQSKLHFTKITKAHVGPKYRAKMKVKLAAQILSNTVAAILKLLAESVENKERIKEILETAEIIQDLDRLFDCTNGPASSKDIKKGIRQNVTKNSFHHKRWVEYKKKLKTLHFLKSDSQLRLRNIRCINGYIITISSLQDIWKYVESKNFKYLNLRQCNQDSLENLFGIIRQHSPTNKNPTVHHFTAALKSSILTRLSTPISKGANCEKDENDILFDFHDIVFAKKDDQKKDKCTSSDDDYLRKSIDDQVQNFNEDIPYMLHIPEDHNFEHEMEELEEMFKGFDKQPTVYVGGYLAKVVLKNVNCETCINSIKVTNPQPNTIYNYIAFKEWWTDKTSLTYPTIQLCAAIDTATKMFESEVQPQMYVKDVCKYAVTLMMSGINLSWICVDHQALMVDQILRRLSLLLIRNECKIINRSFAELEESLADNVKKGEQQGTSK